MRSELTAVLARGVPQRSGASPRERRAPPRQPTQFLVLLLVACGAPPAASPPVASPPVESPPESPPVAPSTIAPSTIAPEPITARSLFEVLVRIAESPDSVPQLAPEVWSVHFPMEGVDADALVARNEPVRERVSDPHALLARYGALVFDDGETEPSEEETLCACDAAQLTCVVYQDGGSSEYRFAREGAGVVVREHHWEYP